MRQGLFLGHPSLQVGMQIDQWEILCRKVNDLLFKVQILGRGSGGGQIIGQGFTLIFL